MSTSTDPVAPVAADVRLALPTGLETVVSRCGSGGLPIMFSHGLFMDRTMFAPQLDDLGHDGLCLAWDERAHGLSRSSGEFTYWDSARDLLALLDAFDIREAILCGMSQGGMLSLRAALLAPERVAGIVMLASHAQAIRPALVPTYETMIEEWGGDSTPEIIDRLAATLLGPLVRAETWKRRWGQMPRAEVGRALRTLVGREDLTGRLHEITAPLHAVYGEADRAVQPSQALEVVELVGGPSAATRIPDGPHTLNLSHPAEVNAVLRDFRRTLQHR